MEVIKPQTIRYLDCTINVSTGTVPNYLIIFEDPVPILVSVESLLNFKHPYPCIFTEDRPFYVELHVPRHLAMRDRVRRLLQFEGLEVHTLALVRQDEERIQRTLGPSGLLRVALAGQNIALKTCID